MGRKSKVNPTRGFPPEVNLTRAFFHEQFEYQYCLVETSREAFDLESALHSWGFVWPRATP